MKPTFIHIYKCGGTSLRAYIRTHMETPNIKVVDQGAFAYELELNKNDRLMGNLVRSEYMRLVERDLPPDAIILTHSFFHDFMKRWHRSLATMLRDPVKRAISQYHFEKLDDFEAWVNSKKNFNFNLQTCALSGTPEMDITERHLYQAKNNLHCFDFVGIVDQYETSIQLFNRIYGIEGNPPIPHVNTTEHLPLPSGAIERIRERSIFDLELFAYAERLLLAKRAAFDLLESDDMETLPQSLRQM
jgi:hypothetical protein